MLYSQEVEREERFKLALRIGIPILILIFLIVYNYLNSGGFNLLNFFILILSIFAIIYFIFFMIYDGLSKKITDPISKAFNRENILKILDKNIKKKKLYTIVLIFIDNLEDINERYGILIGDKILEEFVKKIDNFLKKRYKKIPIGHYKGGEFLVGIEDSVDNVKKILDEFIKRYDKSKINDIEIKIFATLVDKNYSNDIKKIIEYLYQIYSEYYHKPKSKRVLVAKRKTIEADEFEKFIIDIIENRNLSLRFQPALNLKNSKFDLVEVIVKLIDKDGSIIHPSQFIPVINRLGYEKKFDEIFTKKFLDTINEFNLPKNIYYSFNISPYSIRDKSFTQRFINLFKNEDILKDFIVIELFENRLYKDIEYYKTILDLYKRDGFKIAFDNFGGLNASYEYIKDIKADFVYFDKYFTKMVDNKIYYQLLKSWIKFLNSIETKSVIKFIDDEKLINIFKEINVDYLQGYAISKPKSAEELKKFLKENR